MTHGWNNFRNVVAESGEHFPFVHSSKAVVNVSIDEKYTIESEGLQ